ncbi:hypothetical protein [Siccirubricoccus phaeus]|uniref:hypothetical protein n=1 Tax=Siccirubricoccus phaeus TaxID=2595053 RepID=UPI0011F0A3D7|nr:hypothetical protein [Siccirubricoccus phaeus]
MTRRPWRLRPLLSLLLLFGCERPPPDAIIAAAPPPQCRIGPDDGPPPDTLAASGKQGIASGDRGIGGTGMLASGDRGIGGTGIIGVVTGFGSLCVNGLRIAFDPRRPVPVEGGVEPPAPLRAGQVVAVTAEGPMQALAARSVLRQVAVAGPVQQVTPEGTLLVAGQWVVPGPGLRGRGGWREGEWVSVSGLPLPEGGVMASRIDPRAPGQVVVRGTLHGEGERVRIGRLVVPRPPAGAPGEPVLLTGAWGRAGLETVRLRPTPLLGGSTALFGPEVRLVLLEAVAQGAGAGGSPGLGLGGGLQVAAPAGFASLPATHGVVQIWQSESGRPYAFGLRALGSEGPGSLMETVPARPGEVPRLLAQPERPPGTPPAATLQARPLPVPGREAGELARSLWPAQPGVGITAFGPEGSLALPGGGAGLPAGVPPVGGVGIATTPITPGGAPVTRPGPVR